MKKNDVKQLTAKQMKEYITKNAPEDKEWFKSVAFDEDGNYKHFEAKAAFIDRYFPEFKAQPKEKAGDIFKDW